MTSPGVPVGAHEMSQTELRGGSYPGEGDVSTQVFPTVMGYKTPGPGGPERGVEANTARGTGSPDVVVTYPEPPPDMNGDCP